MLLTLAALYLDTVSRTRVITASPLIALAVGDQDVRFVGIELTQFPQCAPWAIGAVLTIKCPPGVNFSSQRYLRIWQGRITYYFNTRDIQSQSMSVLFAQSLP